MLFLDVAFKKTHSLSYLLSLVSQKIEIENEFYDNASELEDFSVEIRYPDTTIDLSDEDIIQSIAIAKKIREFVLSNMNLKIDYKEIKKQ